MGFATWFATRSFCRASKTKAGAPDLFRESTRSKRTRLGRGADVSAPRSLVDCPASGARPPFSAAPALTVNHCNPS